MAHNTRFTDYAEFLTTLDNEGKAYFLEGGQAVNLWAEYFSGKTNHDRLNQLRPFVSKDCDIWISQAALQHLETTTRYGSIRKGTSPVDGQIAIYTIKGAPPLTIDLMGGVYGIPPKMNNRLNERAVNFEGLRVLDPLYLFQSKCHCLSNLPQEGRQDKKHLFILLAVVPEYLRELLLHAQEKIITERNLIAELKLLLKISNKTQVKQALDLINHQTSELFPVDELLASGLPLIQKFTKMTLIQGLS